MFMQDNSRPDPCSNCREETRLRLVLEQLHFEKRKDGAFDVAGVEDIMIPICDTCLLLALSDATGRHYITTKRGDYLC